MMNVNALKLVASTLAVGAAVTTGAIASDQNSAAVSSAQAEMMKVASTSAAIARNALAAKKGELAVKHAEKAVAAMPQDASYRMLLGEAYLSAGRFVSAETAFNDVLSLDAENGRAALKLALAMSAMGKQTEALGVLDAHRETMNAGDYGLALVLAGNAGAAIQTLNAAARGPDANAKVRQNLAFAYAMAGNWTQARAIASQDLQGEQVNQRIAQWAMLSRPQTTADQVAGILGVTPVADAGQPVALALGVVAPQPTALASVEAPVTAEEVASAAPAVSVALEETAQAAPVQVAEVADRVAALEGVAAAKQIVFAPRHEIVQKLPDAYNRRTAAVAPAAQPRQMVVPAKKTTTSAAAAPAIEAGRFAVQLGAYASVKRAEQGWSRIARNMGVLKDYDPKTARVRVKTASLYRLSVTGFATREDASRVCTQIKSSGGECFIRSVAGDQPLRWALRGAAKGGTQLAARR